MSKITLYIASSLDGFIARKNGEVDWLFTDHDYGYSEFYKKIDAVVMGSNTYKQALSFGESYKGKECYVFSRKKRGKKGNVTFVSEDIKKFVKRLKGNVWLVGGSQIIREFLNRNLIDEYRIFIHPILLGNGIPLFQGNFPEIKLKFIGAKSYSSGLAELRYEKIKKIKEKITQRL